MTSILPPPPMPPPPSLPAAPAPASLPVSSPSQLLLQMAPGTQIEGVVLGSDQGQTLVNTQFGTLALPGGVNLPEGAKITLQLQTQGAQTQATITSVNNKAPGTLRLGVDPMAVFGDSRAKGAAPDRPGAIVGPLADAPMRALPDAVPLRVGEQVLATVVKVVDPGQAAPEGAKPAALDPGAGEASAKRAQVPELLEEVAAGMAAVPDSAATDAPPAATRLAAFAALGNQNAAVPANPANPLAATGATLMVRVVTVGTAESAQASAQTPAAATPTPTPTATRIEGIVIGTDSQGRAILQTPQAVLTLPPGRSLAPGTQVVLEFDGRAVPPRPLAAIPDLAQSLPPSLSREWPALKEAVGVLAQQDPQAAAMLEQNLIPQPGPRMAATMLGYMNALQSGDFRKWVGEDTVRGLEKAGRKDLLARLSGDFKTRADMAAEPPAGGEWRTALIPINTGQQVEQLQIHLRRRQEEDDADPSGGEGSEPGSRFLVDLTLTQLGPLQFDGLTRGPRLDLILRSRTRLPDDVRADIITIFNDACLTTGTAGNLSFQAGSFVAVKTIAKQGPGGDHLVGLVV